MVWMHRSDGGGTFSDCIVTKVSARHLQSEQKRKTLRRPKDHLVIKQSIVEAGCAKAR